MTVSDLPPLLLLGLVVWGVVAWSRTKRGATSPNGGEMPPGIGILPGIGGTPASSAEGSGGTIQAAGVSSGSSYDFGYLDTGHTQHTGHIHDSGHTQHTGHTYDSGYSDPGHHHN
jgi:hypothetical protein